MRQKSLLTSKASQEKKKKKKISKAAKILVIGFLVLAVFLFASVVFAGELEVGLEYAEGTGLGTQDIRITIANIIRAALGFLGILAVGIILYGGFIYMTSAGNPEKIEKAKKILINAVIGLLIILMAFAIASFIINLLLEATGLGPPGPPPYGGGGGALGNGIIESHYPARNAFDIPRNTSIVVTFKEEMDVTSIVNEKNPEDDLDDLINPDSIKIRKTADFDGPYVSDVRAFHTDDLKTFVFKPITLLGSPDEPTNYTVELTDNIKKFNGQDAFGLFGGYDWSFEVSTVVDLTPPKIVSVLPRPANTPEQTVPRNHIVQLNFNEAINPMTMRGLVELEKGGTVGSLRRDPQTNQINTFNNINVCAESNPADCNEDSDNIIAGEFLYSNQYKTVEFVTNDLCGKNTCGGDVFCLPENEFITVLVKAASLFEAGSPAASFPYDGIVDMADNSLDGNLDNQAQGPESQSKNPPYYINIPDPDDQGDDSQWSFYTSDKIQLSPPEIERYYPEAGGTDIRPRVNFEIAFDRLIMASTIKPDSGYGDGYCPCTSDDECPGTSCDSASGYCLNDQGERLVCTPNVACPAGQTCVETEYITLIQPSSEILESANYPGGGWAYWLESVNKFLNRPEGQTIAIMGHAVLGENLDFSLRVGSGVKDIFQNCYQPCAGPGCVKEETDTPGVYLEDDPWLGVFPSCEIE